MLNSEPYKAAHAVEVQVREQLGGIATDAAFDAAFGEAIHRATKAQIERVGWDATRRALAEFQTPSQVAAWMKSISADMPSDMDGR